MESSRRIVCRFCKGLNTPGSLFCEYCGASLREQGYKPSGRQRTGRVMARGLKRLIFVVVLLAVLAGIFFAADNFLLPALRRGPSKAASATTVSVVASTTTTTVVPRTDQLVQGADRYATAIALSKLGFATGAPALVIAPGDTWTNAVCAAPLAAAYGGPLLLIPADGIDTNLGTEIQRLNPSQIFLIDVPHLTRVKNKIKSLLTNNPTITSLSGNDRFDTAALIADQIKTKLGTISKVVIAPSDSFAEAIAVAPLAAAKGWPILLSPANADPPSTTTDEIKSLGATSALVVGTVAKLDLTDVQRQLGGDSYETSALIAKYAVTQGLSFAHVAIATGEDFPDGLAAGPYLALDKGILLLAKGQQLTSAVLSLFNENQKAIRKLDFIALPTLAQQMAVTGAGTTGTTGTSSTGTSVTSTTGSSTTTTT